MSNDDDWASADELAAALEISRATFYRWLRRGLLWPADRRAHPPSGGERAFWRRAAALERGRAIISALRSGRRYGELRPDDL